MKIALVGYGKMGQMIEKVAISRGHSIVARLTSTHWDPKALLEADIGIEFTNPESVIKNIQMIAKLKKNVIIGTTGWNNNLDSVQSIVKENKIGALHSPNFSIGINLLLEILAHTSKIMNGFADYDVAGIDYHHSQKKDSPSGTALQIERTIKENMERIDQVPFSSIRCGSIPGTHTILFDSPCDTISITHEARNREGFAMGAVQAAEWLQGKQGLYTFADCMKEIIQRKMA
ncbi:MAG: dihydrodipicolinate reductase [Parachlamydiaceae bacterium]|nr:dihydrodipicolinate reductase [Parachlamydiaceae bacterium]